MEDLISQTIATRISAIEAMIGGLITLFGKPKVRSYISTLSTEKLIIKQQTFAAFLGVLMRANVNMSHSPSFWELKCQLDFKFPRVDWVITAIDPPCGTDLVTMFGKIVQDRDTTGKIMLNDYLKECDHLNPLTPNLIDELKDYYENDTSFKCTSCACDDQCNNVIDEPDSVTDKTASTEQLPVKNPEIGCLVDVVKQPKCFLPKWHGEVFTDQLNVGANSNGPKGEMKTSNCADTPLAPN
jgi:hypothetical protein